MKLIKALIITWSFAAQAGLPPTTLSGQSSATKPTTFGTQVPYNQATSLGGINSLIETGDENMLLNPNFEAPTLSGWTCTSGTCTVESTIFSSGKQSAKIVPSANIFDISQQVNIPANIQKQGVMGLIYNFPATCTTASIQTFSNGTVQTTVPTTSLILDGAFHSIEIPTTFGATSAKIRAFSTATCSGNIYIDKAYISQGIGYQNLMLDNVYSAKISATGAISDSNVTGWLTSCTNATTPVCTFKGGIFSVTPNCWMKSSTAGYSGPGTTTLTTFENIIYNSATVPISGAREYFCQKSGNDYLASSANVYSQASGNYSRRAYTPTFTGLGTVTGVSCYESRYGEFNDIDCTFTPGTPTAVEARVSIPNTSASNLAALSTVGHGWFNYSNAANMTNSFQALIQPSISYVTFNNVAVTALSSAVGNALTAGATPVTFKARIPIAGWSNSNIIVGSFEKIEKCASVAECIDVVSAKFSSSGVISDLNLPGAMSLTSLTDTSLYTIAFSGFTSIPTCTVSSVDNAATNGTYARIDSISLSSIVIRTFYTSGALIKNPYPFNLSCQKTGVDSKPKTAKIASSIGVPTVPGITTEAIDTFSVSYGTTNLNTPCTGSPCIIDQIGNVVSSITRAGTGSYTMNTSKTYTKLKCSFGGAEVSGYPVIPLNSTTPIFSCSSCNAMLFAVGKASTAVASDSIGTLMCQGSY